MSKISAIILAGGRGSRMGANISKQFIEVKNKPLLYYTIKAFQDCKEIQEIILVLPEDEIEYCKSQVLDKYQLNVQKIVSGGKERQISVYNGLKAINNCDVVLIHDGARPFVDKEIIEKGIIYAKEYGACAPGVMPKDTIKVKDSMGFSVNTPDRNTLVAVQTPQCFHYETILKCHNYINDNNILVTDDTMAVEVMDYRVYIYTGSYKNIKITTSEDLILAEKFVEELGL